MPGCVLRVSGPSTSIASVVRDAFVPFVEARGSVLARERGETTRATFNFTVGHATGDMVPGQIQDAETFLRSNFEALQGILASPTIESAVLDFGCEVGCDSTGTCVRWPAPFLALCGELALGVEISVYVVERSGGAT